MKVLVGLVLAVLLVAPSTAAAANGGPCAPSGDGPGEYQEPLLIIGQISDPDGVAGDAEQAAVNALGGQFGGLWFSTPDQGWAIGVAPGPLTLAQAHDAVVSALGAYYTADEVALLDRTLYTYPQLYGYGELRAIQDAIADAWPDLGVGATIGVGCEDGEDAWRVQVELFNDSTPEVIARVQALIAPYGDRVRLLVREGGPPQEDSARRGVRSFVKAPKAKRCIRGDAIRIRVRRAARRWVKRVSVTVAGHRHRVGRTPLRLTLKRRVTRVRITVRLRTGEALRRTYTFRRC
jgi:hypothetical protein